MIREIGSFRFPGFYESIFCNSDEFVDDESELKYEIESTTGCEVYVEYDYIDFKKYQFDVCQTFMEYYIDKIIEVLPNSITEHENFLFEIANKDDITVVSPKYYNYSTDQWFGDVKTNRKTLKLIKEYTLKLNGVKDYLIENFTSCDGFISFLSNNIEDWKSLDIEDYEENMFIALLDMLISLSDCIAFEEINLSTYYDVDKYYYADATVYCEKEDAENIKKHFGDRLKIVTNG